MEFFGTKNFSVVITHPKIKIEPKKIHPFEKEKHLPNLHYIIYLGGVGFIHIFYFHSENLEKMNPF